MDVMCVGEMVIDFLPGTESGSYIRKAGGAPANVAIGLSRNGCKAGFCGKVGNDDFGKFLMETLRQDRVKPLCKEMENSATTTMTFVTLDAHGDRSFTFARKPGADMFLTKEDIRDEYFENLTFVHAGSCSLSRETAAGATRYAMQTAYEKGKLVSFDVNYRDPLWGGDRNAAARAVMEILPYVDLLKISEEEADMIGGEDAFAQGMSDRNISLIVETLGSRGAVCFWNGKRIAVKGLKGKCVDTTGAGDAFWSGLLSVLIRAGIKSTGDLTEEIVLKALQYGNISGWLCVQKKGAIESLPRRKEIESYWKDLYI